MEQSQFFPNEGNKRISINQEIEQNYPQISGIPEIKFRPLGQKDYERRKLKIQNIQEENRKNRNTAVAIAIASLISILQLGGSVKEAQLNFSHNQAVNKAMKPIQEEIKKILATEQFEIYDEVLSKKYDHKIPKGFSYKHRNISKIMDDKFAQSLLEGQIYLGELNEQIMFKENGNMDQIIKDMNIEYTNGSKTMQEYVEKLNFASIEDYYETMKEVQYNISEHTIEQDGPKL